MDYKSLISDCQLRSEEFRMMHNAEGVVHELQCAKAISDLLERAEAEENRVEMLEYANRILSEKITEAEAKCKRLEESRERANESAHMWESRCKMLDAQTAAPEEVLEAIDGLIEFARERMSITDWLYYVNVIGPWRGEKEE